MGSILSTTRLRNASEHELDVRLCHPHNEPESVHPLPPGAMLPLPLVHGGGSYKLCLKPADGEHEWCAQTQVPCLDDPEMVLPATATPLACAPLGLSLIHI